MTLAVLILAVFWLAFSNGANDNFGIGLTSRSARWKTIARIFATWLTTLPIGAALGAGIYWTLTRMGS